MLKDLLNWNEMESNIHIFAITKVPFEINYYYSFIWMHSCIQCNGRHVKEWIYFSLLFTQGWHLKFPKCMRCMRSAHTLQSVCDDCRHLKNMHLWTNCLDFHFHIDMTEYMLVYLLWLFGITQKKQL